MENAKKFFEEAMKSEEAKEIIASVKIPETEEEVAKTYAEIANKLGIELSEEEIKAYFAAKAPNGEIDDEELSQLSGGGIKGHDNCKNTFLDKENCWWNDGCDRIIVSGTVYTDYICSWNFKCAGSYNTSSYSDVVN